MAAINLIVTKEAQDQINALKADLKVIENQILTISKQGLGKKMGFVDVSSQKELSQVLKENKKLTSELDKANKQIVKTNEKIASVVHQEADAYEELNKSQRETLQTFNALQTKKAMGEKLSKQEIATLKQTEAQLKKNQLAYNKISGAQNAMGITTKRTGVAFDSLGFSVAQLTRESPAFLNSVQTGFMALSNNIPIFVDEVDKLIKKNQVLRAEGQKVVPVYKSIGRAILSTQTLISVLILAITVLGPKLFEMAKGWMESGKAIDTAKNSLEDMNKVQEKANDSSAKQLIELERLSTAVQDLSKTEDERNEILESIRKKYGEDIQHLTDKEILTNGLAEAEDNLKTSIIERARAEAAAELMSENLKEILKLEQEREGLIEDAVKTQKTLNEATEDGSNTMGTLSTASAAAAGAAAGATDRLIENSVKLNDLRARNNQLMSIATKNLDSFVKKGKEKESQDRTFIEYFAPGSIGFLQRAIDYNKILISETDDDTLRKRLRDENTLWQAQIDKMNGVVELNYLLDQQGFLKKLNKPKDEKDPNERLLKRAERQIASLQAGLASDVAAVGFDAFNAIADARIEAIDLEMEKLSERYDLQKQLIEDEIADEETRNNALRELDRQRRFDEMKLEKERDKQEKKKFLAKQLQAVGEIAIEAAKGIAIANATYLSNPLTAPLLPKIIGLILGSAAAQTASVVANTIPGFAEGHLAGTHSGLALTNDGGRIEVIQRKNGNLELSTQENRLINMSRGDKVHKSIGSFLENISGDALGKYMAMASVAQRPSQTFDERFKEKMIETMTKGLKGVKIINNNESVGNAVREALRDSAYERKFI